MTQDKKILIPSKWEYVVPGLAIASLIISCIMISSKKFFWNDELFSYYFLADPSFSHMLGAFHDKLNNTPPLYFLLGWLWAKVFGSTELSLRLFSSLGMCIACAITWITLRRTYNFWSTSIGVLSVFCTSNLILSQNAEARMYGLFLVLCALGLFQYDSINRSSKFTWEVLFSNTCIHAAIVNTHLFGLFYSAAIAFSLIVRDKYFKVFRPKVYLSILLSWLSLILYIPSFINQADAGNPRTWIPIPTLKDLVDVLSFSELSYQKVNILSFTKFTLLLVIVLILSWYFLTDKNNDVHPTQIANQNYQVINAEKSILLFAYSFIAIPILIWIISVTVKPVFLDRYLIPSVLSWSIFIAHLSSLVFFNSIFCKAPLAKLGISSLFRGKRRTVFLLGLIAILLVQPITYAISKQTQQFPGLNDNKYGYRELPIVVPFSHDFLERFHYSSERNRYFFILDWQVDLDPTSGLFSTQQYKHMEAWKRNYPNWFQNHIVKSEEFLDRYKQFLILTKPDYTRECTLEKTSKNQYCPRWIEMRIMSDPSYKVTSIGDVDNRRLLLVEARNE